MGSDYAATFNHPGLAREQRRPTPAMSRLEDEPPEFPTTPIYARKRKAAGFAGASPAALIGGAVVLVALAGTVFALSWTGGSEPTEVAAAPVAAAPPAAAAPAVNDPDQMTLAQAPAEPAAPLGAPTTPASAPPPAKRVAAQPAPEP
ncbi:MAG: hypothetical protein ACK4YQ_15785, partial [Phenylobacterium sp.]